MNVSVERTCFRAVMLIIAMLASASFGAAQQAASNTNRLRNDQEAIGGRFSRLERMWSQMADMLRHEDPEYAELLRRVISKGREQAIGPELDIIAARLGEGDFGTAREKQREVAASLQMLMKLLQSEDRRSAVEKERERLNGILNEVRNTIAAERAARGAALNASAPSSAAPAQQKAVRLADDLLAEIKQHDGDGLGEERGEGKPSGEAGRPSIPLDSSGDSQDKRPKSGAEGPSNEASPESQEDHGAPLPDPAQGKSRESGEGVPKSDPPGPGGRNSPGQQPGQVPDGQSEDSEDQTPGKEHIVQARNLMLESLEQLQAQNRDGAVERQDGALAELQRAEKKLEDLLKQLREEEKEMILAAIEARLQRLLAVQTEINETTTDLAATAREHWLDNAVSKCRDLSHQQAELTEECRRATGLLREDGTSVSILVAMEDVEEDMASVTIRLRDTRVGSLTQSIEQDIVESLEELVRAMQAEMEEMKSEEKKKDQVEQGQSPDKPPLVEMMAEIRVLRSLQARVNRRTKRVHELLMDADAGDDPDLARQLGGLAVRQDRLRESASELARRMEKRR